ncbi:MAG: sigma-54 dependent transcriptional regulator, partial [Acidobacteriota bacterium]
MKSRGHILIVEDRAPLRRLLERALEQARYRVTAAEDAAGGQQRLADHRFDLVLTDLKLGDGSGLDVLAASRASQPEAPVVVLTAFGTVQTAVEAMKLGASDFLEKPIEIDELYELVASHLDETSESRIFEAPGAPAIVGRHPKLRAALKLLTKVAPTESTVLLSGESGTGKELFARAIHALSNRREKPFVAINCAAIPEALMENELFGHEKGAFTGANRRQAGRFELAAGGTLFLDEVGELKLEVQGKILRVLEERVFERVGGGRSIQADVRIVTATNRDLQEMVGQGRFRQDLFYRLDVFPIALPPLRDRSSDIPQLSRHLLAEIASRLGRAAPDLAPEARDLLATQPWPGNVRQLANLLERALILCDGPTLQAADLIPCLPTEPADPERQQIRRALTESAGDKHQAADILGMSYRTLQRRIRELD